MKAGAQLGFGASTRPSSGRWRPQEAPCAPTSWSRSSGTSAPSSSTGWTRRRLQPADERRPQAHRPPPAGRGPRAPGRARDHRRAHQRAPRTSSSPRASTRTTARARSAERSSVTSRTRSPSTCSAASSRTSPRSGSTAASTPLQTTMPRSSSSTSAHRPRGDERRQRLSRHLCKHTRAPAARCRKRAVQLSGSSLTRVQASDGTIATVMTIVPRPCAMPPLREPAQAPVLD